MNEHFSRAQRMTRVAAVCVPLLLLAYGVLRSVDRIGGTDHTGWFWVTGHLCFLGAIAGVAVIDLMIRRGLGSSIVANVAVVAGLAGCAAFAWVILHDVFPAMDAAAPTPDLVTTIGPPAFLAGLFTLLGFAARLGRLSWLHLALVVLGFGCVVASLDLLPVAALVLLLGFRPLWSSRSGRRLGARTMDRLPPRQGTARK